MKKNLLVTVLIVSVLLCTLISCSNSKKSTEISFWYGGAVSEAGAPPEDWVALKIIKEKLGIDLKLTMLPSSENDRNVKLNATGASNTLPDIFTVNREVWLKMIEQGLLAEIDDMYELMPVRTKVMHDEVARNYTTINGKGYGFATPGAIPKNEGVLIRKDWLDNLGLAVPKTIDEYFNVMKAFTFNDPDKNGKNDTWGYGAFVEIYEYQEGLGRRLEPIMGAFGVEGTWNMQGANAGLNVRKPAYFDAIQFIRKMVTEGVIDPNWLAYKKDDFRGAWKQGKFGIMREQNAAYASKSNYAPFDKNFPNGQWIVIDPPIGPEGKQSVGVYTLAYRIMAISKKAADEGKKKKIAQLLEWMSSDEGYYLLGWGQEGINYIKNENGIPTVQGLPDPKLGYSQAEMQPLTQLRTYVYYNGKIELLSRYPTYICDVSGKVMSALDVLFDMQTRPYTAAIGSDSLPPPSADVKRFYEQGVIEFVTGKRPVTREAWDAWVSEFDNVGGKAWEEAGLKFGKENGYIK